MMASSTRAALVLLTTLAVPATALQVTPNSACSSVCIDSLDLDSSDPNSSNTRGRDIVCADSQFDGDATGQRFKTCLTCLQGSTHAQGSESDQAWFLYNLRYALDYCIFGYPNATQAASSPCVIPEACGTLATALESDMLTPGDGSTYGSTYGYCDADGGVATGSSYESCLECVRADGLHAYLANFLVALEAGCRQKPSASLLVGVNETVFTRHSIAVTQPSPPASSSSSPAAAPALSTAAIVGVAIAALVLLALASGCAYMQVRKRQNRIRRARRTLSFRCKTAARDCDYDYHDERFFEKKPGQPGDEDGAVVSMSPVPRRGAPPSSPLDAGPASRGLTITTSISCPEPAYAGAGSSAGGLSPDHVTPTASSVSPRSTASLLSPFGRSPVLGQGHFQADGKRGAPGSPVNMTKIQTTFDPPPTR